MKHFVELFSQAIFCSTDPASNRFIQENELNYLEREMGQTKRDKDLPSTPWLSMLTSVPVLALIAAQVFIDNIIFFDVINKNHD